jgi:hypothetical protein
LFAQLTHFVCSWNAAKGLYVDECPSPTLRISTIIITKEGSGVGFLNGGYVAAGRKSSVSRSSATPVGGDDDGDFEMPSFGGGEDAALKAAMAASSSANDDSMMAAMAASQQAQSEEEEMMRLVMAASMSEPEAPPEPAADEVDAATKIQARMRGKVSRASLEGQNDSSEKSEKKKDKKDKHHEPNATCKKCGGAFYTKSGKNHRCDACRHAKGDGGAADETAGGAADESDAAVKIQARMRGKVSRAQREDPGDNDGGVDTSEFGEWARVESI